MVPLYGLEPEQEPEQEQTDPAWNFLPEKISNDYSVTN